MNATPVVKEVVVNAPVSKVWKAITDKDEMKQWYFDLAEFNPVTGFEFRFEGGKDDRSYVHICRITEVEADKKLSYTWQYEGNPGVSVVTFELFAEGERTRVKLTHSGLESFGTENPDFARENFVEGWNSIIGTSLKEYVEKPVPIKE